MSAITSLNGYDLKGQIIMESIYGAAAESSFTISNASNYKMFIFRINGYGDLDKYVVAPNNFILSSYGSGFTSFQVVYHVSTQNQLDYVTLEYNRSTDKITVTNNYTTWGAWGFVGAQIGIK